jgi:hypothetical protein
MTSNSSSPSLGRSGTVGLATLSLATLAFEILLTRILSVTVWYHFAFLAISMAMFGMTAGALWVYLRPERFRDVRAALARHSVAAGLAMPMALLVHLAIPIVEEGSAATLFGVLLTLLAFAAPFFFAGVVVCLALSRFPLQVSRLYAADLLGAAAGCLLVIGLLRVLDGPSAVLAAGAVAVLGAVAFAAEAADPRRFSRTVSLAALCIVLAFAHASLARAGRPFIRLLWIKGQRAGTPLYEKWNAYSRIAVASESSAPFGWGLSSSCPETRPVRQLGLRIDGSARTVLTAFHGDLAPLRYLTCDVTNVAYPLRPGSRVLVIGAGGGRDVLSALVFGQPRVVAVELNREILAAVNETYGGFTGHLDRRPEVTFVADEARSWLERSPDRFDVVQISLIDTWAATSAGAFVLAENGLYTLEAWRTFLRHLTDHGVLTVSRWYVRERPAEMMRLVSLARGALADAGVSDPRAHLVVMAYRRQNGGAPEGIGTLLISPSPFSPEDLAALDATAGRYGFEVAVSPRGGTDPALVAVADGTPPPRSPSGLRLDLSPPTDDRPFFFQMLRLRDALRPGLERDALIDPNVRAVRILGVSLAIVILLTISTLLVPLALDTARRKELGALRGAAPFLLYFLAIGTGFMMIELSQMQRLIIFLGHPVYGLSIVLAVLLLASGLGAFASGRLGGPEPGRRGIVLLAVMVAVLLVYKLASVEILSSFRGSSTPVRLAVAAAVLAPLGCCLGMAFPIGLKLAASRRGEDLLPWLWAANGASSVCASVVASMISFAAGISAAFWVGVACYAFALSAFWIMESRRGGLARIEEPRVLRVA